MARISAPKVHFIAALLISARISRETDMLTPRHPRRRLGVISETLEQRRLLSSVIVNTLIDETIANSTTSLREAIGAAKAGDIVQFKAGLSGQIKLTGGALTIGKSISIAGPGSGVLAVSGNNASRVFVVNVGAKSSISGLKITGGRDVRG